MKLNFILISGLILISNISASDEAPFSLSPSGLRLTCPSYNDEIPLRAYSHSAGLNLVFDLVSRNGIQRIDFERSRIISVVDDSGRNLVSFGVKEHEEKEDRQKFWSAPPTISEDGLACQIETSVFNPLALPSKNATKVHLKAEVLVETNTDEILVPVDLTFSLGIGS